MTISCLCIFLCSYNPAVIFQILKLREKILTILNYAKLLQYLLWQPVSPKEPSNKMQKNQELACCCCCCYIASVVSDSVRPYRRQPTRLCRPGASPGKNTGVACHFLLQELAQFLVNKKLAQTLIYSIRYIPKIKKMINNV